ncbi:MAG TPA: PRC-barrel domain-containing protein [Hyphomicrobiaceae bacterium]|jgi:sporulation protein YlmC with PRC-barrel domain
MLKVFQAALASTALVVSGLALAQTTPPQPEKSAPPSAQAPAAGSSAAQPQWQSAQGGDIRVSKLIGTSVKNSAGETVGNINEIVLGSDGKVAAVVIGVGGFLGLGEREVAVNFDSLHLGRGSDQKTTAALNTTKDALKAAPEWKWSADERRSPTGTKPAH